MSQRLAKIQTLWNEEKKRLIDRYQQELHKFEEQRRRFETERAETARLIQDERDAYMTEIIRLSTEKSTLTALLVNESAVAARQLLKVVNAERAYALHGRLEPSQGNGHTWWFTDTHEDSLQKDFVDLDNSVEAAQSKFSQDMHALIGKLGTHTHQEIDWTDALAFFRNTLLSSNASSTRPARDTEEEDDDGDGEDAQTTFSFSLKSKNLPQGAVIESDLEPTGAEKSTTAPTLSPPPQAFAQLSTTMLAAVQELVALRNQTRKSHSAFAAERGRLLLRIQNLRKRLRAARKSNPGPWLTTHQDDLEFQDVDEDTSYPSSHAHQGEMSPDEFSEDYEDTLDTTADARASTAPGSKVARQHQLNQVELAELRNKIEAELYAQTDRAQDSNLATCVEFESKVALRYSQLYRNAVRRLAELEADRTGIEIRVKAQYGSRIAEMEAELLRVRTDATTAAAEAQRRHTEALREISRSEAAARKENEVLHERIQAMERELISLRTLSSTAADDKRKFALASAEKEELRTQVNSLRRQLQAAMQESRSPAHIMSQHNPSPSQPQTLQRPSRVLKQEYMYSTPMKAPLTQNTSEQTSTHPHEVPESRSDTAIQIRLSPPSGSRHQLSPGQAFSQIPSRSSDLSERVEFDQPPPTLLSSPQLPKPLVESVQGQSPRSTTNQPIREPDSSHQLDEDESEVGDEALISIQDDDALAFPQASTALGTTPAPLVNSSESESDKSTVAQTPRQTTPDVRLWKKRTAVFSSNLDDDDDDDGAL